MFAWHIEIWRAIRWQSDGKPSSWHFPRCMVKWWKANWYLRDVWQCKWVPVYTCALILLYFIGIHGLFFFFSNFRVQLAAVTIGPTILWRRHLWDVGRTTLCLWFRIQSLNVWLFLVSVSLIKKLPTVCCKWQGCRFIKIIFFIDIISLKSKYSGRSNLEFIVVRQIAE